MSAMLSSNKKKAEHAPFDLLQCFLLEKSTTKPPGYLQVHHLRRKTNPKCD